jgi:hypothetical protein
MSAGPACLKDKGPTRSEKTSPGSRPEICLPNTTGSLTARERAEAGVGELSKSLQPAMFPLDDVKHPQTPEDTCEFHELSGPEDSRRRTDDRYFLVVRRPSSVDCRLVEPDGIEPTTSSLQS